jgi:hypothetical protein
MNISTVITLVLRHVLTAVAGGFAVKYGIDGETMNVVISGVAAGGGVAWSMWEKRKR